MLQKINVTWWCGLSAFVMVGLLMTACSGSDSSGDKNENDVIPAVEAVQARYGSLPLSERLSGTVHAENQVTLSPEMAGRITRVYVQDGQEVSKGDPLVKLQDDQYREQSQQAEAGLNISQARLQQAKAEKNRLKSQYDRIKSLREKDLSSEQAFEDIQTQLESARADVKLAEAQVDQARATLQQQNNSLQKTIIRAPIGGTVGQRNAEVGMQVSTGTDLFTIGNLSRVKVNVVLTDKMMQYIKKGQPADVHAPRQGGDQDTTLRASVTRISPFLNNVTRSTEAEIEVKNDDHLLTPGMYVPVDIRYGNSRQATLIPNSALYTDPVSGEQGVFVAPSIGLEIQPVDSVDPGDPPPLTSPTQIEFKPINVIAEGRMQSGISGIEAGSWVVTVGQDLLSEGRPKARVRTVGWTHILTMQGLQRQDLLQQIFKEQDQEKDEQNPS